MDEIQQSFHNLGESGLVRILLKTSRIILFCVSDINCKTCECLVAAGSREDMTYTAEESKDESGETRIYPDDKFRPEGMR